MSSANSASSLSFPSADVINRKADALQALFAKRIAILDGAMGTMIQRHNLSEADFRGTRFTSHPHDLKGNNDLLCITRPDVIEGIHTQYFDAGADMVETNSFNSTTISQADYKTEAIVTELNLAAARVARAAADKASAKYNRPCFVSGVLGPTNRTASMSPDVNRPDFRAVSFDQLVEAYYQQAAALVAGGVDTLLVETIFDTLNSKAALFAIEQLFDTLPARLPVMISVTITDASGRTLSGQTVEAFYNSVAHVKPFSIGINCALGANQMRPFIADLARVAECYITCHPNAGLPNAFGGYDETPEQLGQSLREFAEQGLVNMVGGCCGTTPTHIAAIAKAVRDVAPRRLPSKSASLKLSGLESLNIG